jgi:hypothetical protein
LLWGLRANSLRPSLPFVHYNSLSREIYMCVDTPWIHWEVASVVEAGSVSVRKKKFSRPLEGIVSGVR